MGARGVSHAWPRKRWPILEVAERVERQLAGQIEVGRTDIGGFDAHTRNLKITDWAVF